MSAFTPDLSTLKPIASSPASTFSPDMNTLKPIGESDESRLSRPSTLGEMGGTAADIARGVGKGLHSSAAGISSLLNKIPGVGETLAPSRGVAAYHAMAEPSNTGEQVGKGIEQGVEFFLPAGLEEKAGLKALELAPKLGQWGPRLARVATGALSTGAINKVQGGDFSTGAALGGAGGVIGEAGRAVAPSLAESALGVQKKMRAYGKTPGTAVLDEIKGLSPETIERNAIAKSKALTDEIEGIAGAHDVAHKGTISLQPTLDRIDQHIAQATRENNASGVKQLQNVRDSLTKEIGTEEAIPSDVTARRALDLKRGVRKQFVSNWNPETANTETRAAAKGAGHDIDKALDKVLGPDFASRNQRISSLLPIVERAESTSRGAQLPQRIANRVAARTGALAASGFGAHEGYKAGGWKGGIVGGLAGLIAPELAADPVAQIGIARALRAGVPARALVGGLAQIDRP